MSSVIQEQPADVVVLGMGVTSGFIAAELSVAGYKVVGIEKGPYWDYTTDFSTTKYDEWGIMMMRKFDTPLRTFTYTLRNNLEQMAMPVRRNTTTQIITPGHGVGGMAQHYGGQMGRYGPWTYQMQSETASKYGANFLQSIAPTNDVYDWPLQYSDYEPYYVEFEKAFGVTGTNQGPLVPMSSNYPLPPHPVTPLGELYTSTAEALGYTPYPRPTSLASQPYMNQYGVQINPCVYDGWCGGVCNYVCEVGAKANAAYRTFPAAIKTGNFTMALNSHVFRVDVDPTTNLATDVRYYDSAGNIHIQPGKVFWNGTWGFNEVRLMALSGMGQQYNPETVTGSLGRGVTYGPPPPATASVSGSINIGANAYPSGNADGGIDIFDLADDNFDHTGLNFIGGAVIEIGTYAGAGPGNITGIAGGVSATSMGSTYKASLKDHYLQTKQTVGISAFTPDIPDTRRNIDLDPHFDDIYGDPLARMTSNWSPLSYNGAVYLSGSTSGPAGQILSKMGATNITASKGVPALSIPQDVWGAHQRGGARIGSDPSLSVFNKYHQQWTVQNFFAGGEITNTTGDNTTTGGTHPIGATTYVAAEGMKKYLQSPGPLV